MKRLYFSLIAMIAFVGFAALALADPGTTWDDKINGHHRFKVLREFGGAAVLDRRPDASGSSRRAQTLSVGRHPPAVPAPASPPMRSVTATS
jgi:hypothetical protein